MEELLKENPKMQKQPQRKNQHVGLQKKKIKAFCVSKDIVKKVKRQVIGWGKYLRHKERDRFF